MTESQFIEELVLSAASGDKNAQREVFRRYWPVISKIVWIHRTRLGKALSAREEPNDLLQGIAIEILENLPRHKWQGRSAFVAWMRRLAEAVVIDAARYHHAQRRDPRVETPVSMPLPNAPSPHGPESMLDQQRELVQLEVLLEQLKPEYAAAVRLHHMGYSHSEVGDMLGCSAEAARKLVARAESKLLQLKITYDESMIKKA